MSVNGYSPAQGLQEENNIARLLLDLLKKEQAQLVAADIDALNELTEEKTALVAKLAELAEQRYLALSAAGFAAGEAGMQDWLESTKAVSAHQSWKNFLTLAQEAKEMNRVNGLLIGKHLARNQQALNLLKGNNQGQALYGPNGQSSVSTTRGLAIG